MGSTFRVQLGVQCGGNTYVNWNPTSPTIDTTPLVWSPVGDPAMSANEKRVIINDDFLYPTTPGTLNTSLWPNGWLHGGSGGTATAGAIANQNATRMGYLSLSTGTTATGYYASYTSPGTIFIGTNQGYFQEFKVAVPTASDGTNTFTVHMGSDDAPTFALSAMTVGVCVAYEQTTSANWLLVTGHAGTLTKTSIGIAANSTDVHGYIIKFPGEDVYRCYVGGALVATNSTNMPTTTDQLSPEYTIKKTAGTTARTFELDRLVIVMTQPQRIAA
jgi:hypothetical protein